MAMAQLTEEINCESIEQLIANLERPPVTVATSEGSRVVHGGQHHDDVYLKDEYFLRGQSYIFRGNADSDWMLLPSLFRDLDGENFEKRIAQLVGVNRYRGGFDFPTFSSFNGNFSEEHYRVRISLIMESVLRAGVISIFFSKYLRRTSAASFRLESLFSILSCASTNVHI